MLFFITYAEGIDQIRLVGQSCCVNKDYKLITV